MFKRQEIFKFIDFIQKIIIFILFVINIGSFLYIRLFNITYINILKLNSMLFSTTVTGVLIFLVINMILLFFVNMRKNKKLKCYSVTALFMSIILIIFFCCFKNNSYIQSILTIPFDKISIFYWYLMSISSIIIVLIIWLLKNYNFSFLKTIWYALGFVLLIAQILFFTGEGTFSNKVPSFLKIPMFFLQNSLFDRKKCMQVHDMDVINRFNNQKLYDITFDIGQKSNIIVGLFMIFIIIIKNIYKIRIEYYLAILASLLLLSNTVVYVLTVKACVLFFAMLTIILPATLLLRDKSFLKLFKLSFWIYFLTLFFRGTAFEIITILVNIIFILLSVIYLYKYYKTANENPELIEKNRFLKEYLD